MYSLTTSSRFEFRVWDKVFNRFVSGPFESRFFELRDYDITQFTGVLDTTNRKMFEGDVVTEWQYEDWGDKVGFAFNGIVYYSMRCAGFYVRHISNPLPVTIENDYATLQLTPEYRIIGNIFENPELVIK